MTIGVAGEILISEIRLVNAGVILHHQAGARMHQRCEQEGPNRGPFCFRGSLLGRGLRRLWSLSTLALFEPVAVAVHFQDMDVVGEAVEQCAGQSFGAEHAGPLVERQVRCDDG